LIAKLKKLKKYWAYILAAALVVAFLFNENFRNTISRRRAIKTAQKELAALTQETEAVQRQITALETNPHITEHLVRKELGYLRPGEKEIRFLNNNANKN
jgi:cell division protein FtsB